MIINHIFYKSVCFVLMTKPLCHHIPRDIKRFHVNPRKQKNMRICAPLEAVRKLLKLAVISFKLSLLLSLKYLVKAEPVYQKAL